MVMPQNSTTAPAKVTPVNELGMTVENDARLLRACAWVRVTPALLPYLRDFLVARLARYHYASLAAKIARMEDQKIFRLWEHLKDKQFLHSECRELSGSHSLP
jgi:hypothetical protein